MKNIVKNTSIYTLGNVLTKSINLFLLPLYSKYLSPGEYGIVGSMIAFQAIIAIFFSLSLETAITRFFWDYTSQEKRRRLIGSLTLIIISIASIIIVILFLANKYVAQIYSSIQFYPYYSYAILYTYLMVIPNIFKIYLRMSEKALNYVYFLFLRPCSFPH